jgi:hypothetical protein
MDMYKLCRHIKPSGLRCESPALKGGQFCYYHSKLHSIGAEPNTKFGPLQLPPPEDAAAIQLTVARTNDAIINGRLDIRKATALYYGLQIAAQFIDRNKYFPKSETVQSPEPSPNGDELAPNDFICDSDEGCDNCPHLSECNQWESCTEDEDADDEEQDEEDGEGEDDESDDEVDGPSNEAAGGQETVDELIAQANQLDSITEAVEAGDMRLAERLLKALSP